MTNEFEIDCINKRGQFAVLFHTTEDCIKFYDELNATQQEVVAERWPHAQRSYVFDTGGQEDYVNFCRLI